MKKSKQTVITVREWAASHGIESHWFSTAHLNERHPKKLMPRVVVRLANLEAREQMRKRINDLFGF